MDTNQSSNGPDRTAEFVALFGTHNRRIYAFVRTFIHNRADADEVFQETCSALWAKFDQYQTGTNFWSWACRVARFEALRFLRHRKVHFRLFSDSFYETVERRAIQLEGTLDAELDALADCYAKLRDDQRQLIDQLYLPAATVKSVAALLGRTCNAVYKALGLIHKSLFDCIQRTLEERGKR